MKSKTEIRKEVLSDAVKFLLQNFTSTEAKQILKALTIEDIHWSRSARFAKMRYGATDYFWENRYGKRSYSSNREKPIRVAVKSKHWYTYKKKTVGVFADGIKVSNLLNQTVQLIHEIIHMIQRMEKRTMSEVETTEFEIKYVKENNTFIYDKLLEI